VAALLPERPAESSDAELAMVLASLPAAMRNVALAAGVGLAPTVSPTFSTPPSSSAEGVFAPAAPTAFPDMPSLVLAPPAGFRLPSAPSTPVADAHESGGAAGDASSWLGGGELVGAGATVGAGSGPGVQFASIQREVTIASEQGAGQPEEVEMSEEELDALAEQVYETLRWRLLSERDRTLGW
jgi:hypothetical protein